MKQVLFAVLTGLTLLYLTACAPAVQRPAAQTSSTDLQTAIPTEAIQTPEVTEAIEGTAEYDSSIQAGDGADSSEEVQHSGEDQSAMQRDTFYVTIEDMTFAATFEDNSGAEALKTLLEAGPVTIDMNDYGGFEKVGALGQSLPTSNAQTTTQAGDIVLYQGDQIVMFYGSNSWSYTRLGKVDDLTGWADALGSGAISATFSLTEP